MATIERLADDLAAAESRLSEIDRVLSDLSAQLAGLELERDDWLGGQDREAFENEDDPEFEALEDDIKRLDHEIHELRLERAGCMMAITGIQMESRDLLREWNESAGSAVAS